MKKIILAILCLFYLGMNAQTIKKTLLLDSTIAFDFTNVTDSIMNNFKKVTYDSVGNKIIVEYVKGNSGFVPNSKTVIKYDSKHREISNESYSSPIETTVWEGLSRKDFQFNVLDKIEKEIEYTWDNAEQDWVAIKQTETKTADNGFVTEIIGYEWLKLYQKMVATTKREFTADSKGKVATIKTSHLDENTWVNDSLIEYHYTKLGKDSAIIYNAWNVTKQNYEPVSGLFYTYENNGNKRTQTNKLWQTTNPNTNWLAIGKTECFLDSFGNDTTIIESYLSNDNWVYLKKKEKSFDKNGNLVIDGSYDWNYIDSIWVGTYKTETIHDDLNTQTSNTQYYWDYNNSKWFPSYQYKNTYNNNNQKTHDYMAFWDYEDSVLVTRVRIDYYYDKNDSLAVREVWAFKSEETQFSLTFKEFYYYSDYFIQIPQQTQLSDELKLTVSLYPNPAHSYLYINTFCNSGQMQIISSNGRIAKSIQFDSYNTTIAIDDLSDGIWFVAICTETEKTVKQFVILK
ncbi:MAG: T9SS type A sorting domain-containing protein [Bacteroidales bacterium]|nr:T9SS type A sorting domain-containing protein [Bacteroidales bacterium]